MQRRRIGYLENRSAARARAFAASSSRFLGGACVSSELSRLLAIPAISSTAAENAASFALDGLLKPLTFLTNCSAAAWISSSVTGGSKLNRVLMFLHTTCLRGPFSRVRAACHQLAHASARDLHPFRRHNFHSFHHGETAGGIERFARDGRSELERPKALAGCRGLAQGQNQPPDSPPREIRMCIHGAHASRLGRGVQQARIALRKVITAKQRSAPAPAAAAYDAALVLDGEVG